MTETPRGLQTELKDNLEIVYPQMNAFRIGGTSELPVLSNLSQAQKSRRNHITYYMEISPGHSLEPTLRKTICPISMTCEEMDRAPKCQRQRPTTYLRRRSMVHGDISCSPWQFSHQKVCCISSDH